ncbi:MAG: Uma2 family endonuclease [Bryobacterales bacterium]|nr:Uma2 family endonuclease [Bryobacterales bacterium]
MSRLTQGITIEEFEQLPHALAFNHELVDGELVDVSGNTLGHNRFREYLIRLLSEWVIKNQLGEVVSEQEYDFDGNAHGPDVTFFRTEKMPLANDKLRVQRFVPDLAIEIVSKNDTFEKLIEKAHPYRKCGTKEVWIFSIDSREAYVYSPEGPAILDEDALFQSSLIPGFSIRIGDLFDRL